MGKYMITLTVEANSVSDAVTNVAFDANGEIERKWLSIEVQPWD